MTNTPPIERRIEDEDLWLYEADDCDVPCGVPDRPYYGKCMLCGQPVTKIYWCVCTKSTLIPF